MTSAFYSCSSQASGSLTGSSHFDFLPYLCFFCLYLNALLVPPLPRTLLLLPPPPSPIWDLGVLLASLCFVLLSFAHFPPIWIPPLISITRPYYLLLLLPPCFPLFFSVVSLSLALCLPVGSLSESLLLFSLLCIPLASAGLVRWLITLHTPRWSGVFPTVLFL